MRDLESTTRAYEESYQQKEGQIKELQHKLEQQLQVGSCLLQ